MLVLGVIMRAFLLDGGDTCPPGFHVEGARTSGEYLCTRQEHDPRDAEVEVPRVLARWEVQMTHRCERGRIVARMDGRGVRCARVRVDADGVEWLLDL